MRFREKLLILLAAVIVSVLGFYLISSPFVGLHTMTKEIDNEKIENFLAECDDDTYQAHLAIDKPFQFSHFGSSDCDSTARYTIGTHK